MMAVFTRCGALTGRFAGLPLPDATPPDVVVAENPPRYVGPIVAGNRVLVISKSGLVHILTQTMVSRLTQIPGMAVLTLPQIASGKLLVLGVNGTLSAFE